MLLMMRAFTLAVTTSPGSTCRSIVLHNGRRTGQEVQTFLRGADTTVTDPQVLQLERKAAHGARETEG